MGHPREPKYEDIMMVEFKPVPESFDKAVAATGRVMANFSKFFEDSEDEFLSWMLPTVGQDIREQWLDTGDSGVHSEIIKRWALHDTMYQSAMILRAVYAKFHKATPFLDIHARAYIKKLEDAAETKRQLEREKIASDKVAAKVARYPKTLDECTDKVADMLNSIEPEIFNAFKRIFIQKAFEAYGDFIIDTLGLEYPTLVTMHIKELVGAAYEVDENIMAHYILACTFDGTECGLTEFMEIMERISDD